MHQHLFAASADRVEWELLPSLLNRLGGGRARPQPAWRRRCRPSSISSSLPIRSRRCSRVSPCAKCASRTSSRSSSADGAGASVGRKPRAPRSRTAAQSKPRNLRDARRALARRAAPAAMQPAAHHHFVQAKLLDLHPTQMTCGFAEVALKRREWAGLAKKARKELLASHWFPAVLGPRGRSYIVDHHHLGLALQEEGVERVKLMVLDDLSYLAPTVFWRVMEQRNWVHPFDATGKRRPYAD